MARTLIEVFYDIDRGFCVAEPAGYDADEGSYSSENDGIGMPVQTQVYPVLHPYSSTLMQIQFVRSDGSFADLSAFTGDWDGAYGNPKEALHEVDDADINDEAFADLPNGQVTIKITLPVEVSEDLGTAASKKHYLEIRAADGDAVVRVIGVIPCWTQQVVFVPGA